jgi:hypothetical protein
MRFVAVSSKEECLSGWPVAPSRFELAILRFHVHHSKTTDFGPLHRCNDLLSSYLQGVSFIVSLITEAITAFPHGCRLSVR